MTDEKKDMNPENTGEGLPASLDQHLREVISDQDLPAFREQLPHDFISDATEGLDQIKDSRQLESVLKHLNQQMHHQLHHKKTTVKRRAPGDFSWTYWAIILILIFCVIGFVLVRMFLKK